MGCVRSLFLHLLWLALTKNGRVFPAHKNKKQTWTGFVGGNERSPPPMRLLSLLGTIIARLFAISYPTQPSDPDVTSATICFRRRRHFADAVIKMITFEAHQSRRVHLPLSSTLDDLSGGDTVWAGLNPDSEKTKSTPPHTLPNPGGIPTEIMRIYSPAESVNGMCLSSWAIWAWTCHSNFAKTHHGAQQ